MERLVTGQFQELYDATIGKQVYSLVASTNRGQIKFKMVDIPGQEKTGLLKQQYYENADGAFIMFDVTCRDTYRGVPGLYKDVKQWYETKYDRDIENFPFVLIGNKVDFTGRDRKVKFESIRFHHDKENNMNYYEMSNKTDFNLEQPFLWMARFLLEDHQLELIGRPVAIDEEEATDADEMDID
jgi:GTP-binding nuclear protein Ran